MDAVPLLVGYRSKIGATLCLNCQRKTGAGTVPIYEGGSEELTCNICHNLLHNVVHTGPIGGIKNAEAIRKQVAEQRRQAKKGLDG